MKKYIVLLGLIAVGTPLITESNENKIAYFERVDSSEGGVTGPVLTKCDIKCESGQCMSECTYAMETEDQLKKQGYKFFPNKKAAQGYIAKKTK